MKRHTYQRRLELLGSASTAMALLVAGSAFAAPVGADATFGSATVAVTGNKTVLSDIANSADVSATIDNSDGGIQTDATSGGNTTNAATGNDVLAGATGNAFHNEIDLATVDNAGGMDGAASLGRSSNVADANVTSSATGNDVTVDLTDFVTGSATNDANTISATSTANDGSTLLSGTLSSVYSSSATGSAIASRDTITGTAAGAQASLAASTGQTSINPANTATAASNTITTSLNSTADNTVTASPSVSVNAISATVTGNASQSTIDVAGDDTPQFTGSAVVSNLQESAGGGESTATNASSTIGGEVYSADTPVNTLTGALAVEGNTITSSAANNMALGNGAGQSGNEIVLDDALSFTGNAGIPASIGASEGGSDYIAATSADLAVQNVQTALGDGSIDPLAATAQTVGADVYGVAEALDSGSVSVSDNAMTATAQSNTASSRIANGENAAGFAGTAALANLQDNQDVDVSASSLGNSIGGIVDTDLSSGSVASNGNTVSASAYGNQVSQTADLQATALALGTGEASLSGETGVSAAGSVVVGSMQANTGTDVSANQSSTIAVDWLALDDSTMAGSSLTASGNTQAAVALGSSAANRLSLEGTTVGTGAGIANLQVADETSTVQATSSNSQVGSFARESIEDSESVVTDNLQRSIAYGASSGNNLDVTANAITIGTSAPTDVSATATFDPSGPGTASPLVQSAYGLVNRQAQAGEVSATAVTQTAFENRIEGDVTSGSLQTDGNTFVAAAYGTDTGNTASIDANAIDTGSTGYASVATVTNAQTVSGSDILARATGENVVLTDIYGETAGTSVSTSQNTVQALAYGNRSTGNRVTVDATNIDTSVDDVPLRGSASLDTTGFEAVVDASFAAQNVQTSSGTVTATLLTEGVDPTSAQIRTQIGDSVTAGSVVSEFNLSAAGATANRATTAVTLDANQLASTAGVQNVQLTSSDLSALIGVAGTGGSPGDPGTPPLPVSASGGSSVGTMSLSGDTLTVSSAPVAVTFTGYLFTADDVAYLNGLGNVSGATVGGNSVTFAVGTIDTTAFNSFLFDNASGGSGSGDEEFTVGGFTIPGTAPTPAVLATPNQGGVTIAIGDDVTNTSVSVSGNSTSGSVLGNGATNSLLASATEISGGGGALSTEATGLSATADLALSNVQVDDAGTEASTVYGTFAIDATAGEVTGSSLTVSNNSQRSDASSNLASNTIDASATNVTAGSALGSSQQSSANVSAMSDLDVFAPGASTQSSTQMDGNTNTARAVVNEANNTVKVAASNVNPVSTPSLVANPTPDALTGDHTLFSAQTADGSAIAMAASNIFNGDGADLTTTGLSSGSIEIAGNSTTAQSVANLAANSMSIAGSANQAASAGIANQQTSSAGVSAFATSAATVTLAGDSAAIPEEAVADDGAIRIADNATTAVARGNSASNVLNMDAGATYGTIATGTSGTDFSSGGTVTAFAATGAVLNQQANSGTVSATSTGVSYQVALNATAGSPLVTGSTASVSGNAVNAEAYGNNATNRIAMTALNSGTPSAAIGNYQQNSAGVTATVTSVSYGVAASAGAIGNSTFSATGNQVAATAVGNNAVSVIAAGN